METSNHINLHFKPNPVKTNDKILQNDQKTLIWDILGQTGIFIKNLFLPVFLNSDEVLLCKISEKGTHIIPYRYLLLYH